MPDYPVAGSPGNLNAQSVTIPAGAAVSERISTQGRALVGIIMPGTWTAADIGYQACLSGNDGDMRNIYDSGGAAMTTPVGVNRHVAFPTPDAIFVPYLRLTSVITVTVTPVNQVAAATIILLFRSFLN